MDDDRCYECRINGDDSYINADGDLVWVCDDCPFDDDYLDDDRGGC